MESLWPWISVGRRLASGIPGSCPAGSVERELIRRQLELWPFAQAGALLREEELMREVLPINLERRKTVIQLV